MGLAFSCPEGEGEAFNNSFESLLYERSNLRFLCSNCCDSEPSPLTFGSGKLIIEGSVSVERRETEPLQMDTKISINSPSDEDNSSSEESPLKPSRFSQEALVIPRLKLGCLKHEAALKLQKVYKSFRTRRQLADCAVLVEQSWWKLLDFALLKRSSISFFDIKKPESIVSKWSRARTRAAKVGKGLSKNGRARKLALQHWLEAIDPRHRYGHNLQFYYECWLRCESNQPFFYWLDVGEGKEINLNECLRSTLQQQCIRYLGPKEREAYEVIVEDGKLIYKKNRECLDTTGGPIDSKWIFVLGTLKNLYVGQKKKGMFQHSSFLAGGATSAAGSLVVENGVLKAVWPHSGHYRPTEENFEEFMSFLNENNVDLSDLKKAPAEDENEWGGRLQSPPSEPDLIDRNIYSQSQLEEAQLPSNTSNDLDLKSACEPKQKRYNDRTISEVENSCKASNHSHETIEESRAGSSLYKRRFGFHSPNLFIQQDDVVKEILPKEEILLRFYNKEGMKSCQLGEQLSFKWTTGAGPRIGCVRDCPYELQFRALEQVSLSPRGSESSRPFSSSMVIRSPRSKMQESSTLQKSLLQNLIVRDRI
ncbi:hypothetical protein KFK09_004348 [Dendrobium nobile]|uniref:Uncharacterized protein n=1 Tax=Dendrobium nobile TaxID=94219 RepID=A0A8T3C5X9_DENNO|nr:hypothetical protein KFK09_004348 [Dendrobium nobile]